MRSWVAEQSSAAPKELWTDGVEDYLKYAKQLMADYRDVLEQGKDGGAGTTPAVPAPAAFGFGFGAPAGGKPPLAPTGLFGSSGGGSPASAPASIFGSLPASGGSGGFALGGGAGIGGSAPASAANSGGSGLFTVPSTGTLGSSFATGAGGGGGGDDDEGGEGEGGEGGEGASAEPSVQLEAEGTEMLAKQRVKLMSMTAEKKWKGQGEGTLTLRRPSDDPSARPYFVFTTDSGARGRWVEWGGGGASRDVGRQRHTGIPAHTPITAARPRPPPPAPVAPRPGRVLINAPLVKGMTPMTNAKAPAAVIMFLISNVDGKEERLMHMFRRVGGGRTTACPRGCTTACPVTTCGCLGASSVRLTPDPPDPAGARTQTSPSS